MKKIFSSYWIRSAFYSFLQRFSLAIFGFLTFGILARTLSIPRMSEWAIFWVITGIFEQAKSSLLKNAHIKYVSSSQDREEHIQVASSSFFINATLTLFFILLIFLFSGWVGPWFNTGPELAVMLKWFVPGMIFMVFFAHLEAVQQSFMDFKGGFAGYFVRQVTFFGVILAYKISGRPLSLSELSMYQSVTIGLGTLVLFLYTRKYLHFQFRPSQPAIKKIVGYGGYIFGSSMMATVSSNLDQLMTGKFIDAGSIAYYTAASRINTLVDVPSYAASEILFPKASRASAEEGRDKIKYLFEKMVAVLLAFTIPTAVVVLLIPRLITTLVAGHAYGPSVLILQLYMITGIFRPAQNQAANLLNSVGKPRLVFIANTIYLVLFLGINYLCLRKIGFYGAAVGSLITNFIGCTAWYFIMRAQIGLQPANIGYYMLDTYRTIIRRVTGLLKGSATS